jgi:proteasome lid subunit RPN8/RPN11
MTQLWLNPLHARQISDHAQQAYPEECCGLLLGIQRQLADMEVRSVLQVVPSPNAWTESLFAQQSGSAPTASERSAGSASEQGKADLTTSLEHRYAIDPSLMIKAQQHARAKGWDIIGIYHSHPNHEAMPSKWDRQWAWQQYSYVIVSVKGGTAQDLRSWTLDRHHEFLPEKLVISEATDPQVMPNVEDPI